MNANDHFHDSLVAQFKQFLKSLKQPSNVAINMVDGVLFSVESLGVKDESASSTGVVLANQEFKAE